jgi:predicted metal-dependent phosphoesterase TrpH
VPLLYAKIVLAPGIFLGAGTFGIIGLSGSYLVPLDHSTVKCNPILLIDLHTHSYPKSDDSFMGVDDLVDAAKKRGLDGVCLTEHDTFWTIEETQALSRRHQFLVLPGVELNTDSGHVVAFGLEGYVFGLHKPFILRNMVDQRGGIIIAAHPYRRRFLEEPGRDPGTRAEMLERAVSDDFFRYCDAVEGVNGRGSTAENRFSRDIQVQLGMKAIGGSDAHRVDQLGTAVTRFQDKITCLGDLIEALRAGRFCAVDLRDGKTTGSYTH